MQLISLKKGFKPLTIATGLLVGSPTLMYADLDQFSEITAVIANPKAAKYIQEVDNQETSFFIAKRKFYDHFNSWQNKTMFFSSVKSIVDQDDFKAIVSMGTKVAPFILEELEKGPSNIVWALNMIYRKKITDKPNVTIGEACKLWIKELKNQ